MIYRQITDPSLRTDKNWHSQIRDWVYPKPVADRDPDCRHCLSGRDHSLVQHEQSLNRARS